MPVSGKSRKHPFPAHSAVSGILADSGGASLPLCQKLPGIPGIRVSGHGHAQKPALPVPDTLQLVWCGIQLLAEKLRNTLRFVWCRIQKYPESGQEVTILVTFRCISLGGTRQNPARTGLKRPF